MRLHELDTPCLLLEHARLMSNIERFDARAQALGVGLRPHLKTSKSAEVAALIPSVPRSGATVSTLREAEHFFDAGLRDLLYAVCIAPQKLDRAAALVRAGARLLLAVDDLSVLGVMQADRPGTEDVVFEVLVELDSGERRSGVSPEGEALIELARQLDRHPRTRFAGVFTHAGHSYEAGSAAEIRAIAAAERESVCTAARRLEAEGLRCAIRSVGSTPTFAHVDHLEGITEARPGVYVFGDLFQAGLGTCAEADIALSVLSTVISARPEQGRLVIDAGGLALSKDRSTRALRGGDRGYGQVCAVDGQPIPGAQVVEAYQEHGIVRLAPEHAAQLPVGAQVRVLPNHACMTAAAHDVYNVIEEGEVVAAWPRVNTW